MGKHYVVIITTFYMYRNVNEWHIRSGFFFNDLNATEVYSS